jgi:hypothetical protein
MSRAGSPSLPEKLEALRLTAKSRKRGYLHAADMELSRITEYSCRRKPRQ